MVLPVSEEKMKALEKETTKLLPDASQPVGGTIDNEKEGMEGWSSATFGRGETVRDMMTRTEVSCHGSESEIVIYIGTAVTTRQGRGEAEEKGERWGRGGGGGSMSGERREMYKLTGGREVGRGQPSTHP
jgi:hypothetical protein